MFFKPTNKKTKKRPKLYYMKRSLIDWLMLGVRLLIVAAVVGVVYGVWAHTSSFKIQNVEVVGEVKHLTANQLKKIAQVPMNENLFLVNLHQIELNIRRFSWIKGVQVRRNFPHTIEISVSEYEPLALLSLDQLYYVSVDGDVFKRVEEGEDINYPVITGFEKSRLESYPGYYRAKLQSVMDFLRRFDEFAEQNEIELSEINYQEGSGITVYTNNVALSVFFGFDDFDKKFENLSKVLALMQGGQKFRSLDLHVVGKVFGRL